MSTFEKELEQLINSHSVENESNTPDFILAGYLMRCLENWRETTTQREEWYGTRLEPGGGVPMQEVKATKE